MAEALSSPALTKAGRKSRKRLPYVAMAMALVAYFGVVFIYPLLMLLARSVGFPNGLDLSGFREIFADSSALLTFRVTLEISIITTIVCPVLAYPLALLMTLCGPTVRRVYMVFLIVPFLTSVLIRMFGWIALLSPIGAIPKLLGMVGLGDTPLLYNRFGVIIGMTYALLPYAVFTIYGVMKSIDMTLLRASRSLGAGTWPTFRRILLPLTMPGVAAAAILVFVLSLGYFVTPRLMGGPGDQTIASLIETKMELSPNIPVVVALSLVLLIVVGLGFVIASRLIGFRNLIERRGA